MFDGPVLESVLRFVEELRPIAEGRHRTLPQLALAWILRRPEITAAIAGCRSPEQAAELAAAGDWMLDGESIRSIEEASAGLPSFY